jgi:hypothetical protein
MSYGQFGPGVDSAQPLSIGRVERARFYLYSCGSNPQTVPHTWHTLGYRQDLFSTLHSYRLGARTVNVLSGTSILRWVLLQKNNAH